MSLSSILATVKSWLVDAEQFLAALFSKIVRDEQELIPVIEGFITKAEAAINRPVGVVIENLIPDGIGVEIVNIFNEVAAWVVAELTAITPTLITSHVAGNGVPQYANPNVVIQAAFTKVSQLGATAQAHFLSGYQISLLQHFSPAGVNLTYEEGKLATALAKTAIAQQAQKEAAATAVS